MTRSDDLEILIAVADLGSFSRTAEMLDVQVAKVSRTVARVEQQLGITLFQRTTRRVELTEEGRGFLNICRVGLGKIVEAEEWLKSRQEAPSGKLRINAASPFIQHQLVGLIAGFNDLYPHISVELQTGESIVDLLEKRTDVAIRLGALSDSTLYSRMLGRSPLYLVGSPDYFSRYGMPKTATELRHHRILGFIAPTALNHWPVGSGVEIEPDTSSSNGEILRQLCLAGNGIACLSNFMVHKDLCNGDLVKVLEADMISPHPREQVQAVYYRNTALASRISVFLDFISDCLEL
ncbi:LysR family transcriptional regulator [Parendozoicomonas sp. Alg238-R29]|uniref:LysR family transcriptional regulator n=1 Tax=Parendozoicomonas sp. Alg238-R29 TaxID=2993446 RepID=UPI00248F3056|nr:LysR family transcriptional regulator [Parendozoicomonas sp. Alg238-R29]